jgi:hypothetical protein
MSTLGNAPKFQAGAPSPQNDTDWQQLIKWLTSIRGGAAQAWGTEGTHALRLTTAATPDGAAFFENERRVWYVAVGGAWIYAAGIMPASQATLPADLGGADYGFLVSVGDYGHLLQWNGSGWVWGPGDEGSGKMVLFEIDPTGVGWHLYDGSTVNYLQSNGALGEITLPNLQIGVSFLAAGPVNSAPRPAVAPSIVQPTIAVAETGITNPATTGGGNANIGNNNAATEFSDGTGAPITVASNPHVHSDSGHDHTIGAPTDPGHTHALSMITANTDGLPASLERRAWFRC